jgi:two-component system OmpR family response regulator
MTQTVLIVDDHPELCELFAIAFKTVGFEVSTAHNGVEALTHLRTHHTDVMTLDLDMPVMSGLGVLREMDQIAQAQATKVIIATGNDVAYMHEDTGRADLILLKPIGFYQLVELAKRLISGTQ